MRFLRCTTSSRASSHGSSSRGSSSSRDVHESAAEQPARRYWGYRVDVVKHVSLCICHRLGVHRRRRGGHGLPMDQVAKQLHLVPRPYLPPRPPKLPRRRALHDLQHLRHAKLDALHLEQVDHHRHVRHRRHLRHPHGVLHVRPHPGLKNEHIRKVGRQHAGKHGEGYAESERRKKGGFFTWILLAGFVLFPGTFTNLQQNKELGAIGITAVDAIKHVSLYVIAWVCTGLGAAGMLYLWYRWSANYIWCTNRI
ncbi:hypothetical protein B0H12DRAFT_1259164, partial [Mycena haematopus]